MASNMPMEQPLCLVGNDTSGDLTVNPAALEILRGITQPVVVVTIAGLYRTGKSYLMNQLAGKRTGFSLGSTVQSHTKGIWMWCLPHPCRSDHVLVLLDTEGLGDVEKGNTKNDCWIFALAVLLSSLLVYNSKGIIDQYAMEQLYFVSELTDHIKVKAQEGDGEGDDTEFVRFFPGFIWAVRDFTLQLIIDGQPVTEDQYLENALALKPGSGKRVMEYNLPRQCLRSFFPTRKCFIFVQPVPSKDISQLELLPESSLDPQFLAQTHCFCNYVFQEAKAKTIKGGHCVNGRMFSSLVQNYVKTIRSGQVPCIDNAVIALAAIENEVAIKAALAHYKAEMRELQLPVELEELLEAHGKCEEGALKLFMERSFKDSEQQYQQQLMVGIAEQYGNILAQNEDVSKETCLALLEELSAPMKKNLSDGVYSRPGGYGVYKADLSQVVESYRGKPNKGVQAEEVLDQFLTKTQPEAAAVLKADTKLTEAEKHIADEKQKAEVLEQQRKAAEEKRMQTEQLMKDQERSYQENLKQLEAKMKDEAERARKEAAQALECKLKEQEAMLHKGFTKQAKLMQEEIESLKKEMKSTDVTGLLSGIFTTIGEGLRAINSLTSLTRSRRMAQPKSTSKHK
uniref:Guanylate-binding protein 1-like n=2 Tax=Crocodylus porosus TaxID=8502 RepID=A0A7M4F2I0_CROPO